MRVLRNSRTDMYLFFLTIHQYIRPLNCLLFSGPPGRHVEQLRKSQTNKPIKEFPISDSELIVLQREPGFVVKPCLLSYEHTN